MERRATCPECGNLLRPDGGCSVCPVCGYSACELTYTQYDPPDHFERGMPGLADRDFEG